jgi:hypothetical protein
MLAGAGITLRIVCPPSPPILMRKHRNIFGLSILFLGVTASPAFAQTAVTMDQPDNGFYEAADPEWAVLHSTDMRGTMEHREYHRAAARAHLVWHDAHRAAQGLMEYENDHRIFHQERNMSHRLFHMTPLTP